MRLLGISGSLREGSWNSALLRAAVTLAPPGADLRIYNGLKRIPPFDEDAEARVSPAVEGLRREVHAADALLIATPEYNGSLPGQLKNALDWASRPFGSSALRGTPVAVISASTGLFGGLWAQEDLRRTLSRAGAVVADDSLALAEAARRFDSYGGLLAEEDRQELARVVASLVAIAVPCARSA